MAVLAINDTIRMYMTDTPFRTGVRSILEAAKGSVPQGLDWAELPAYYRAIAAAHHVRSDFAIAYIDMWNEVWGPLVPEWKPISPDDQQSLRYFETPVDVSSVDQDGFIRCFEVKSRGWLVALEAWFNADDMEIAISAMPKRGSRHVEFAIEGFEFDKESGVARASHTVELGEEGLDLTAAVDAARRALSKIE